MGFPEYWHLENLVGGLPQPPPPPPHAYNMIIIMTMIIIQDLHGSQVISPYISIQMLKAPVSLLPRRYPRQPSGAQVDLKEEIPTRYPLTTHGSRETILWRTCIDQGHTHRVGSNPRPSDYKSRAHEPLLHSALSSEELQPRLLRRNFTEN